jgi:hypothetical protein
VHRGCVLFKKLANARTVETRCEVPAAERFKLKRIEIRNERIERLGEKATRFFPKATREPVGVA